MILHARQFRRAEPLWRRKQMQLVSRIPALALTAALLLGAACSDDDNDPTGPTVSQVAGTYTATRLTATSVLGTQDVLQGGGSLTAVFNANGTVTGHAKVPSEGLDEDFAGEWKIDDGEVEIEDVAADIFFEDLKFKLVNNTLVADQTISGVRLQVTLAKQQ
jgi:hypothetical protein